MNVPVAPIAHAVRVSVLENEAVWRLAPDALEREEPRAGGQTLTARFSYTDVQELRLSFAPTRFDSARYRCDLRLKYGTIGFVSTHYAGVGDFEDRAASYGPLVRGLVTRVGAANPACRFRAGKRSIVFWAEHAFLLAMIALLVAVLGMTGGLNLSEIVLIKLGILCAYIPLMIMYTRKNWPRRFDSTAIPNELVPG